MSMRGARGRPSIWSRVRRLEEAMEPGVPTWAEYHAAEHRKRLRENHQFRMSLAHLDIARYFWEPEEVEAEEEELANDTEEQQRKDAGIIRRWWGPNKRQPTPMDPAELEKELIDYVWHVCSEKGWPVPEWCEDSTLLP